MKLEESTLEIVTLDNLVRNIPEQIRLTSSYFDDLDWSSNNQLKLEATSEVFDFIIKHLEIHKFNPPGVSKKLIMPQLKKNLCEIDYEHVKHLQGLENIEKINEMLQFCNKYNIPKIRQVYICLIATEFSMIGRGFEELNQHLINTPPPKYRLKKEYSKAKFVSYERLEQLKEKFPFTQWSNNKERAL